VGGRWSFQSAAFQDAVYKLLEAAHRKRIHRHAFEVWQGILEASEAAAINARAERTSWVDGYEPGQGRAERTSWDGWDKSGPDRSEPQEDPKPKLGGASGRARRKDVLERLARHAGACGAAREAAEAHLALAQSAMDLNRHVEADHHYSAALGFLDEGDARRRAVALTKRAKARYQLYRATDALEDLQNARDIAQSLGDDALVADILLEEATALDHANDYAESAERVELVRPIVERLNDRTLTVRYWVALGRTRWRQERVTETIELLSRGADGAKANGDYGTRVVALLFLSCSLAVAGRVDEAIVRYIEVIELCMKVEDRLHLGMAYLNRVLLWLARKSLREGIRISAARSSSPATSAIHGSSGRPRPTRPSSSTGAASTTRRSRSPGVRACSPSASSSGRSTRTGSSSPEFSSCGASTRAPGRPSGRSRTAAPRARPRPRPSRSSGPSSLS
jgi:tetratricopeptide (TPR) repeat protein